MEIQVNYDYREGDVRECLDVEALARYVVESEGMPSSTELSVSFVENERIHALNRDFRGIDRPTDVLSFECDGIDDDFAEVDEAFQDNAFELGDIVIAPDVAQEHTDEYGTTFADELALLEVHGLLHLCGWDHTEESEAIEMEKRERELLEAYLERPFER